MVPLKNPTEPISQRVLTRLRERLREMEVNGRKRLPPERELARELKVGRRSVRDALSRLEAEGVVWRRSGVGTIIVTNSDPASNPINANDIRHHTSPRELM